MREIADESIDMIATDLPYGITGCSWDTTIPFEPLWIQYKRIIKDNGAIVLNASQPFTSMLVTSNLKMFKYEWIWNKEHAVGFQVAKYRPMQQHENILVFCKTTPKYIPQMIRRPKAIESKLYGNGSDVCPIGAVKYRNLRYTHWYPKSIIIKSGADHSNILHPTQKPVALMEYLIRTYTNEGDYVLDSCMGSGTTGVACVKLRRNFIGIELNPDYFKIVTARIEAIQHHRPYRHCNEEEVHHEKTGFGFTE